MSMSVVTHWNIQWAYLITDLVVLGLSVSYIDLKRLACSLLTVLLSGQIIGFVQRFKSPEKRQCRKTHKKTAADQTICRGYFL